MESNSNNILEVSISKTDNNLLSENNNKVPRISKSLVKKSFKEEKDEDYSPEKDLSDLKSQSIKDDKSDKEEEDEDGDFNSEEKRKLEKRDKIVNLHSNISVTLILKMKEVIMIKITTG